MTLAGEYPVSNGRSPNDHRGGNGGRPTPPSEGEREDRVHGGVYILPTGTVRRWDGRPARRAHVLPAGQRQGPGHQRGPREDPGDPARRAPGRAARRRTPQTRREVVGGRRRG